MSDSNIVEFLSRERMVWCCDCGNQSFYMYDTGDVECVVCNTIQEGDIVLVVPRKQCRMMTDEERERFETITELLEDNE
jgi:hypothetical protein